MAYFMNGTRLAGLEREMMLPPNFKPRGHGRMVLNRFRYKPEDVDCKLCTEYRHRRCTQPSCPWLAERIESGVVCYDDARVVEIESSLPDQVQMAVRQRNSRY